MKNAIIYSLHCNEPKIDSLSQWQQTRYSIDTLRLFNADIPIKVYLSPPGILDTAIMPYEKTNVEFIEFDAQPDKRLDDLSASRFTSHKWTSTFNAIEEFTLDNALYVDGDTIWNADPEILFDKYGNSERIYTKQDLYTPFINAINLKSPAMNDGVNMVSKKILKHKNYITEQRVLRVVEWQQNYKDKLSDDLFFVGIQWAACQYAISEALADIGEPVYFFDDNDVLLSSELSSLKTIESVNPVVFHYFNQNSKTYLKNWYSLRPGLIIKYLNSKYKIISLKKDGDVCFATIKNLYDQTIKVISVDQLRDI